MQLASAMAAPAPVRAQSTPSLREDAERIHGRLFLHLGGELKAIFGAYANLFAAATRQEMSDAKLPLAYRDSCAHLLIPLNKCRPANWYLPWKCEVRRFTAFERRCHA